MSTYPPAHERRLNMHLMGYWQSLRGGRQYVTPEQFDPKPLGSLWAHCFVVDAHRDQAKMIFRHLGEEIAAASEAPTDLETASQVLQGTLLSVTLKSAEDVLLDRQPVVASGEFFDLHNRRHVYRSILLPLGESWDSIKFIAGGARCKLVEAEG